jgi:hypothetical protein
MVITTKPSVEQPTVSRGDSDAKKTRKKQVAAEPTMTQIPTTRGLERLPLGKSPIANVHIPALDDPRSPLRDPMKSPSLDQPSSPLSSYQLIYLDLSPPTIERAPKTTVARRTKRISLLQMSHPTAMSRR